MELTNFLVLAFLLAGLAAFPSSSTLLVVVRSATSGRVQGAFVAAGIVAGDLVFVVLALYGLSAIAESMAWLFLVVKYLGAGYLIWFGCRLVTSSAESIELANRVTKSKSNTAISFCSGLFLTLGDVKAIFFYLSLLPALMPFSSDASSSLIGVVSAVILGVGAAKLSYVFLADRVMSATANSRFFKVARKAAGAMMIGTGSYVILRP